MAPHLTLLKEIKDMSFKLKYLVLDHLQPTLTRILEAQLFIKGALRDLAEWEGLFVSVKIAPSGKSFLIHVIPTNIRDVHYCLTLSQRTTMLESTLHFEGLLNTLLMDAKLKDDMVRYSANAEREAKFNTVVQCTLIGGEPTFLVEGFQYQMDLQHAVVADVSFEAVDQDFARYWSQQHPVQSPGLDLGRLKAESHLHSPHPRSMDNFIVGGTTGPVPDMALTGPDRRTLTAVRAAAMGFYGIVANPEQYPDGPGKAMLEWIVKLLNESTDLTTCLESTHDLLIDYFTDEPGWIGVRLKFECETPPQVLAAFQSTTPDAVPYFNTPSTRVVPIFKFLLENGIVTSLVVVGSETNWVYPEVEKAEVGELTITELPEPLGPLGVELARDPIPEPELVTAEEEADYLKRHLRILEGLTTDRETLTASAQTAVNVLQGLVNYFNADMAKMRNAHPGRHVSATEFGKATYTFDTRDERIAFIEFRRSSTGEKFLDIEFENGLDNILIVSDISVYDYDGLIINAFKYYVDADECTFTDGRTRFVCKPTPDADLSSTVIPPANANPPSDAMSYATYTGHDAVIVRLKWVAIAYLKCLTAAKFSSSGIEANFLNDLQTAIASFWSGHEIINDVNSNLLLTALLHEPAVYGEWKLHFEVGDPASQLTLVFSNVLIRIKVSQELNERAVVSVVNRAVSITIPAVELETVTEDDQDTTIINPVVSVVEELSYPAIKRLIKQINRAITDSSIQEAIDALVGQINGSDLALWGTIGNLTTFNNDIEILTLTRENTDKDLIRFCIDVSTDTATVMSVNVYFANGTESLFMYPSLKSAMTLIELNVVAVPVPVEALKPSITTQTRLEQISVCYAGVCRDLTSGELNDGAYEKELVQLLRLWIIEDCNGRPTTDDYQVLLTVMQRPGAGEWEFVSGYSNPDAVMAENSLLQLWMGIENGTVHAKLKVLPVIKTPPPTVADLHSAMDVLRSELLTVPFNTPYNNDAVKFSEALQKAVTARLKIGSMFPSDIMALKALLTNAGIPVVLPSSVRLEDAVRTYHLTGCNVSYVSKPEPGLSNFLVTMF